MSGQGFKPMNFDNKNITKPTTHPFDMGSTGVITGPNVLKLLWL
jgi:hypothetical protein